jgi:hypothetical protein
LTQEDRDKCHIQTRHFSFGGDSKHFYANDLENPYTETKRFDWIRGDIVGGDRYYGAGIVIAGAIWISKPINGMASE